MIIFLIGYGRFFPFLLFKRHNVVFCNGEGFYAMAALEKQQQQKETERSKDFSKQLFPKVRTITVGCCVVYYVWPVAVLHDFISTAVRAVCNFMASVSSCTEEAGLPVFFPLHSLLLSVLGFLM